MTDDRAELRYLSIAELAALIGQKKLSPVELAETTLARVEALNGRLNAICTIKPDLVRAQAKRAEQQIMAGEATSPLSGIPIGIKDLIFTNDLASTGGSTAYRDFVPEEDDVTVERLRQAGAVILGKTNVPEFGMGFGSTNPVFGATRNPWNLEKTPGGSSGGSAAAVASGLGPGALGSDGGGSVRVPSSYCGTYGFKASFGRIPLYPGCRDTRYPGFSGWEQFEHIGPITRTVKDAALMLDVLVGPDRRDRHSLPREVATFTAGLDEADVRGLRIAWTTDFGGYARVDAEVGQAVERAARTFESMGAHVENATPFTENPGDAFIAIVALDFDIDGLRPMVEAQPDAVNARIAGLMAGDWTFEQVSNAFSARRALYNQVWRFFERYDLLLTPTTPTAAFDVGLPAPLTIGGLPATTGSYSFTSPFNMTGSPAASIPAGWTEDGLPIGLQIIGGHLADQTVLRASAAFERAAPWADRLPFA
jgi:aspartyl-tRNA(Asn)/glutamyl-tRNA(Gln) amidotransferase subunit A